MWTTIFARIFSVASVMLHTKYLSRLGLLRNLKRLAGRPAEARAAEFLQRRQIMQLWRRSRRRFCAISRSCLYRQELACCNTSISSRGTDLPF
jgi:hypothetical protein